MRIHWSKVLSAVTSLALVAGGVGAVTQASSAASKTTITFWNEMTGPYKPVVTDEIKAFEKLHPNIVVQDITIPNDAALRPKLLAAVVGGDPPTLSQMNPPWATGFIQNHQLVNLTTYIHGKNGLTAKDLKDFYPSMMAGGRWPDGNQYLMPFNLSAAIMFFDKNQFQAAGIKAPPTTWAQWSQDLKKLSTKGRHAFAITLVHAYPFLAFFYQAGGHFVGKNNMPNPAAFAPNGAGTRALALWTQEVKSGEAILTQGYASQTDFANGTSSVLVGTSAFAPYLVQAVAGKFTIGVAPLPAGVKKATSLFGGYLGMFAQASTAQKNAAWLFIKYLTSVPGNILWLEKTQGYLPVRESTARYARKYLAEHEAQRVALEVLPTARPESKPLWWSEFSNKILINAIDSALLGRATPAQAMKTAYQQALAVAKGH